MVDIPAHSLCPYVLHGSRHLGSHGIQNPQGNGFCPQTMIIMGVSFLIMGLTGLILPFLIHIWNKGYIWVSIVLMVFVFVYMAMFNETSYKQLRRLVGLPYMKGNKELPAEPPSSPEEVAAVLNKTNITGLIIAGYVVPAIVLWLMVFKPF
jgi:hypothetical protein